MIPAGVQVRQRGLIGKDSFALLDPFQNIVGQRLQFEANQRPGYGPMPGTTDPFLLIRP